MTFTYIFSRTIKSTSFIYIHFQHFIVLLMAFHIFIRIYILSLLCHSLISAIVQVPVIDSNKLNTNKDDTFSPWHRFLEKLGRTSSTPSTDLQRRNVIMPRICYFSRVTQSGIHQRLCLPYNSDSDR